MGCNFQKISLILFINPIVVGYQIGQKGVKLKKKLFFLLDNQYEERKREKKGNKLAECKEKECIFAVPFERETV